MKPFENVYIRTITKHRYELWHPTLQELKINNIPSPFVSHFLSFVSQRVKQYEVNRKWSASAP